MNFVPRTLLWRSFLLISLLMVISVVAWFQILRSYEREPRARQLAQMVVSVVNLTHAALVTAKADKRRELLAELSEREGIRVYPAEPGDKVTFDQVLLAGEDGAEVHVGTPRLTGATVTAEVLRHGRAPKIIIFKRKRRDGYRRKKGHRQGFTEIRIDEVALA